MNSIFPSFILAGLLVVPRASYAAPRRIHQIPTDISVGVGKDTADADPRNDRAAGTMQVSLGYTVRPFVGLDLRAVAAADAAGGTVSDVFFAGGGLRGFVPVDAP